MGRIPPPNCTFNVLVNLVYLDILSNISCCTLSFANIYYHGNRPSRHCVWGYGHYESIVGQKGSSALVFGDNFWKLILWSVPLTPESRAEKKCILGENDVIIIKEIIVLWFVERGNSHWTGYVRRFSYVITFQSFFFPLIFGMIQHFFAAMYLENIDGCNIVLTILHWIHRQLKQ